MKHQDQENHEEDYETLDFNNPIYKFTPPERHEWVQQGPYIICTSCELQHSIRIGMSKRLVDIDEKGQPVIKKVTY